MFLSLTNTNTSSVPDDYSQYIKCQCGKKIPFVSNSKLMGAAIETHAVEHVTKAKHANHAEEVKKIEEYLIQQVIKKITAHSQP